MTVRENDLSLLYNPGYISSSRGYIYIYILLFFYSNIPIFKNFEGVIFKIGVFRRMMKIAPIDAPRRELFYSFLRVKNGYELRFLRPYRVFVFLLRVFLIIIPAEIAPRFYYPRFFNIIVIPVLGRIIMSH